MKERKARYKSQRLGKRHNIVNKGDKPLKLYSIYARPEHPHSTMHHDKVAADAEEHHH